MSNQAPFEIIAQPFQAWVAPVGTPFPTVDENPADVGWTLIGKNGDRSMDEKGVVVSFKDKTATFRALGSTGPIKAFRPEEDFMISFLLADMTLEAYSHALNSNTVATNTTQSAGVSATKKIGLSRGSDVQQKALLLRGDHASPEMDGVAQFEVPRAFQSGAQKPTFVKKDAAMLDLEYTALEDLEAASADERFGRLVVQTSEPGT